MEFYAEMCTESPDEGDMNELPDVQDTDIEFSQADAGKKHLAPLKPEYLERGTITTLRRHRR